MTRGRLSTRATTQLSARSVRQVIPIIAFRCAKRAGYENKEGKRTRFLIQQTRLIRCLLYGLVDYLGKGTRSFDVLTGDQDWDCNFSYFRIQFDFEIRQANSSP